MEGYPLPDPSREKSSARELDIHFMKEALKEARRASGKGDIPVGAVVVHENKVIARAHNQVELLSDPTAHAEMIAITQAADYFRQSSAGGGGFHPNLLTATTLYATLEPCPMCAGALVLARVGKLVYATRDPKAGACRSLFTIVQDDRLNHRLKVTEGVLAQEAGALLTEFFKTLRKEKR